MAKHYDNKHELLRRLRENKTEAQCGFAAQTLLALYVLHSEFGFGQARCERFVKQIAEINQKKELAEIQDYLLDKIGFAVELPNEKIKVREEFQEVRIEL